MATAASAAATVELAAVAALPDVSLAHVRSSRRAAKRVDVQPIIGMRLAACKTLGIGKAGLVCPTYSELVQRSWPRK